jgi:geranylgeranyl pyrophosphate synthase
MTLSDLITTSRKLLRKPPVLLPTAAKPFVKLYSHSTNAIAESSPQVSILAQCTEDVSDIAYQYGRNIGIAFQVSSLKSFL